MDIQEFISIFEKLPGKIEQIISSIDDFDKRLIKLEDTIYHEFLAKSVKDRYIPIETIIRELGISKRKLAYMKERGELEFIALNRHQYIREMELERLMNEHTVKRLKKK